MVGPPETVSKDKQNCEFIKQAFLLALLASPCKQKTMNTVTIQL